jgi:hypothetical protein
VKRAALFAVVFGVGLLAGLAVPLIVDATADARKRRSLERMCSRTTTRGRATC